MGKLWFVSLVCFFSLCFIQDVFSEDKGVQILGAFGIAFTDSHDVIEKKGFKQNKTQQGMLLYKKPGDSTGDMTEYNIVVDPDMFQIKTIRGIKKFIGKDTGKACNNFKRTVVLHIERKYSNIKKILDKKKNNNDIIFYNGQNMRQSDYAITLRCERYHPIYDVVVLNMGKPFKLIIEYNLTEQNLRRIKKAKDLEQSSTLKDKY
ncbi:MAG: hypothetical protein HQL69_06245 [Magnetococcales bacterium]|nr:hypothetical protein [Magnetococcales bacterium]